MSNIVNKETYDQSVTKPLGDEIGLPSGKVVIAPLGLMATCTDCVLRLYGVVQQPGGGSFSLDAPLPQDEMVKQMVFDHRKRSLEKGEGMEEFWAQACREELEDGFYGRVRKNGVFASNLLWAGGKGEVTDDEDTAPHTDDAQPGRKKVFSRAAFFLSMADRYGRESLTQELKNNIKAMQDFLQNLQNCARFLEQLEKLKKGGNIQKLIAFLKKHYAGDPDMLKKVDELANKAEAAAEANKDLDSENWFDRAVEEFFHAGRAQNDHNTIDDFSQFLSSLLKEINSRALEDQPQLALAMGQGRKAFIQRIHTLVVQMSKIIVLIDLVQGMGDGEKVIFKTEAILVELMSLANNNNYEREQQKVEMANLNIHIQDMTAKKLKKTLEQIEKSERDQHGIIGFLEHLFTFVVKFLGDLFTLNIQGLSYDFTKSDFITDLKNFGEFFYNFFITLQVAVLSALTCGQVEALNKTFLDYGQKVISSPALHLISDIVMLAVIVASCLSGQFWLAAVMTALLLMNDLTDSKGNTLMTDLTNGIAEGVEKLATACGGQLSKDAAKAIADTLLIVVVAAITFGVGAPVSTVESSVAVGEDTVSTAAEDGLAQMDQEGGALGKFREILQKAKDGAKKVGNKIGYRRGLTMTVSGMLMNAVGFPADVTKALAKDDEHLKQFLSTLLTSIAMLMTIAGGTALSVTMESAQTKLGVFLKKLTPSNLMNLCDANGADITSKMLQIITASMIVSGGMDVIKGSHQILFGILQRRAKILQGRLELASSRNSIVEQIGSENSSELKHIAAEYMQIVKNMGAPALASSGIAYALQGSA